MAQLSESRAAAQPNIQDAFLNYARRERLPVTIHLIDGRVLEAQIKHFDRFAVVIEVGRADQLVFKHAIATIATDRSIGSYLPQRS